MIWIDALRLTANALSAEAVLELTVQSHPGLDMFDPAYAPPQLILVMAGELQGSVTMPIDPTLPPLSVIEHMTVNRIALGNSKVLNIRSIPGTTNQAISSVRPGQILQVRGSTKANRYTWAELLAVDGIKQSGYVAREYLVSA